MTNSKSIQNITEKDMKKLNREYARGRVYIEGLIREQQDIIKESEAKLKITNEEIVKIRKELEPYTKGVEFDDNYRKLKRKYADLLIARNNLQKAIIVADESISEAKLSYIEEE